MLFFSSRHSSECLVQHGVHIVFRSMQSCLLVLRVVQVFIFKCILIMFYSVYVLVPDMYLKVTGQ